MTLIDDIDDPEFEHLSEYLALSDLYQQFSDTKWRQWQQHLPCQLIQIYQHHHAQLQEWLTTLETLPDAQAIRYSLKPTVHIQGEMAATDNLKQALRRLMPWRKGPFTLFDINIDTEWRSDWKWQRVSDHIDLKNRTVLDVGCGNGYYGYRMLGAGARFVLGIDPSWLYLCQFLAIKRYLPTLPIWQLPFTLEQLPTPNEWFDVTFSMGILYHRRSPLEHLGALKHTLRDGGTLVLETLVVEGDDNTVFMPTDRYAQMRNVWFLPSVAALIKWLERLGFKNVRCVDISLTTVEEQRRTEWMALQSLADFLRPDGYTIEGYPPPMRAIIMAEK